MNYKLTVINKEIGKLAQSKARFVVLIGGRGSGKSVGIANILLAKAMEGKKIACFREFQSSMQDSVYSLLCAEIDRQRLQNMFEIQSNQINFRKNGETAFVFRGMARSPENVKSYHDFDYFWVEEGQSISFESLKALTPTLRKEGSQIFISANPRSKSDAFSQRFFTPFEKELRRNKHYSDDLHCIYWVNYDKNPKFPTVLEDERLHDKKSMSAALYKHIWEGEFYDEVQDSLISVEWFDSAIDAHTKLGWKGEGAIIASHDPSDTGGDSKGFCVRRGNQILDISEMVTGEAADGMDWALDKALEHRADWFVWDCDGLGVSLKRQVDQALGEKNGIDYFMFKGSEGVEEPDQPYTEGGKTKNKTNRETFYNKRAQYWWRLRDRFYNTYRAVERGEYVDPEDQISLSSNISNLDQIRSEVCRIPLKRSNTGKIQIMSKIEMAKKPYQLPSPNMGDALMMACYRPKTLASPSKINFAGWND